MVKKLIVSLALLITLTLLSGCQSGVPQAQYDAIVAERDELKLRVETLETEALAWATVGQYPPSAQATNTPTPTPTEKPTPAAPAAYLPGDSFAFNNWDLSIGTDIAWAVLTNRFSEYDGRDVIAIPITAVNNLDESRAFSYYDLDCFSPSGQEVPIFTSYFDESITDAKVRQGAEAKGYIYVLYEGDGLYIVEFDRFGEHAELQVSVSK